MPERTLVIDTSGTECSVALIKAGRVLAQRHERIGRGHAECLMPWIAALPNGGKADAIVVGCGPGSFTGVRVGIAAARGLGLGWNVPVRGISSLLLVAADAGVKGDLLVAVEGGHGEVFVQPFAGEELQETAPVRSLKPEDAARLFDQLCVAGSGAMDIIDARGAGSPVPASARAAAFAVLAHERASLPPSPIYGRAPDAKPPSA